MLILAAWPGLKRVSLLAPGRQNDGVSFHNKLNLNYLVMIRHELEAVQSPCDAQACRLSSCRFPLSVSLQQQSLGRFIQVPALLARVLLIRCLKASGQMSSHILAKWL